MSNSAQIEGFERQKSSSFMYLKFLRNQIQELKGNIRVLCRVRPSQLDPQPGSKFIKITGMHRISITLNNASLRKNINGNSSQENKAEEGKYGRHTLSMQNFEFDAVFGPRSTQDDIFREINPLVLNALDGYKICIFAYGQTGSGKTYTMEGDYTKEEHKGIIPRAVHSLFDNIHRNELEGWQYQIEASFQEIYLNEIRDLLSPNNTMKQLNQALKYEPTVVEVTKVDDVYYLLDKARENRVVAETTYNARSSRSHSLFQLIIKGSNSKLKANSHIEGAINLIDLAGSERLDGFRIDPERIKESKAINKSLSGLGDVISALANQYKHIPYRNSKLTYLLQPHLSSNSGKTLMIVNVYIKESNDPKTISQINESISETINSLRFASKVNSGLIKEKQKLLVSKKKL